MESLFNKVTALRPLTLLKRELFKNFIFKEQLWTTVSNKAKSLFNGVKSYFLCTFKSYSVSTVNLEQVNVGWVNFRHTNHSTRSHNHHQFWTVPKVIKVKDTRTTSTDDTMEPLNNIFSTIVFVLSTASVEHTNICWITSVVFLRSLEVIKISSKCFYIKFEQFWHITLFLSLLLAWTWLLA